MKCSKRRQLDEDELVVKVTKSSGREEDIIVRSTHETMTLAGDDYVRFRIIQPRGHEKEEIVHRVSRGYEELLISVFLALAKAGGARRGKKIRRPPLKSPLPI